MSRPFGKPNKNRPVECFPGTVTFPVVPEMAKTIARLDAIGRRHLNLHLRHAALLWLLKNAPRQT